MLSGHQLICFETVTGGIELLFRRLLVARPASIENAIGWPQVYLIAGYFLFEVVVYYLFYRYRFCLLKYIHGLLLASTLEYGSASLAQKLVVLRLGMA